MCGILGGWSNNGELSGPARAALARLRHRGPDDEGYYSMGPAFIGMRRLSIIDLAGGNQPIFNEDRSIAVVLNGEIYNYRELIGNLKARGHCFSTESDTEALVHLYEEKGVAMVEDLRGMFAFSILDNRSKRLFVARDRLGKKPLYYTRTSDGGWLFASELKALRVLATAFGGKWRIRPQSIYDYLSLSAVPQPDTIFEGVWSLPQGSWMNFDGQKLEQQEYWSLRHVPKSEWAYPEILEQTRCLIGESVSLRLRSDVPLGVFLSGGIDSSIVAYEASKVLGETLRTFTVSVDDPSLNESEVAQRTAKFLGVRNTILPLKTDPLEALNFLVPHYDQPFADSSAIPTYAVSQLARQHVKVILNGDGGDELFGGYRRHLASWLSRNLGWIPQPLFKIFSALMPELSRRSSLGFSVRFLRGLSLEAPSRYLAWTTDMLFEREKLRYWVGPLCRSTEELVRSILPAGSGPLETQMQGDMRIILLSILMVKMDMATMAASLEARSPFLDHVLAEFTASLRGSVLLRGRRTKAVLRDAYGDRLPNEVITAKKRGFEIPLVSWLKNELRQVLMDTVGSSTARVHKYLDATFVRDLLQSNTMSERNWGYIVYALLVLELWLRDWEDSNN